MYCAPAVAPFSNPSEVSRFCHRIPPSHGEGRAEQPVQWARGGLRGARGASQWSECGVPTARSRTFSFARNPVTHVWRRIGSARVVRSHACNVRELRADIAGFRRGCSTSLTAGLAFLTGHICGEQEHRARATALPQHDLCKHQGSCHEQLHRR